MALSTNSAVPEPVEPHLCVQIGMCASFIGEQAPREVKDFHLGLQEASLRDGAMCPQAPISLGPVWFKVRKKKREKKKMQFLEIENSCVVWLIKETSKENDFSWLVYVNLRWKLKKKIIYVMIISYFNKRLFALHINFIIKTGFTRIKSFSI